MWGGQSGCGRGSRSQPGLAPPSVLVLVFLLVFFNLIILRRCESLLEGKRAMVSQLAKVKEQVHTQPRNKG